MFGHRIAQPFLFPLGFLILMVPLPLAERIGPVLESWTATSATRFAQGLGVPAQNIGSQVFLPNSAFTVGITCGGLRSGIAILTLVTLFAYLVRGAGWARALIFFAAMPIALAANTLRLTLLLAIANVWGAQAGLDYFDSPLSSLVLFLSAFALLLIMAKWVGCWNVRWEAVLPA
jgi:exosortase